MVTVKRAEDLLEPLLIGVAWSLTSQIGATHQMHFDRLAWGGFTQSPKHTSIRIDYVQHALGACAGALAVLDALAASGGSSH